MHSFPQPCSSSGGMSPSLSLLNSSSPYSTSLHSRIILPNKPFQCSATYPVRRTPEFNLSFFSSSIGRCPQIGFCSKKDVFDDFSSTQLSEDVENGEIDENEELELLNRPDPVPLSNGVPIEIDNESGKPDEEAALAPFLKLFKPRDSPEQKEEEEEEEEYTYVDNKKEEYNNRVSVEYYEPKTGDFVVGVVVSGNENKLDVNVGADLLGTMLTKEVLPLYDKDMEYLLCDLKKDAEEFMVRGKTGIVRDEDAMSDGLVRGRPVVETGTVLFAEVLGRTLSGRPLLSTRRLFRRMAWHRVRQIEQLSEPIQVKITEWNTGGLLTRIEGLRAFLPKAELLNRVNNFTELKENAGRRMYVQITRVNEATNDLILSERAAWEMLHLKEGTLLEGTVKKIFAYGAQIKIGDTNRSGLLHISNMSRSRVTAVSDLLNVDEKVKVLVVKSMFPDKIALSIADLESEPGLFISKKERVFSEAEEMAKKYRLKLPPAALATPKLESPPPNTLSLDREATFCANWKWFKFESDK